MGKQTESIFRVEDFVPSLREALGKTPLDMTKLLRAAIPVEDPEATRPKPPAGMDRHLIPLTDGKVVCDWRVESLRALCRGDKQPPVQGDSPDEYNPEFLILETHALEMSNILGDRTDAEMKEIYSNLRRRPDGKSVGFYQDYMWQGAAVMLGTRPLSQAEFEAILGRLERSCRTFSMGLVSRNYIGVLRRMFEGRL